MFGYQDAQALSDAVDSAIKRFVVPEIESRCTPVIERLMEKRANEILTKVVAELIARKLTVTVEEGN